MPHDPYKALYIHIPFCVKRCSYCDFTTQAIAKDSPRIDEYIEQLCFRIRKLAHQGELARIETVYLGGGTPSYVGQKRLSMLLYTLGLSMHLEPDVECSMEANPESLSVNMVRDVWALGVNRLSIGVQSFDDAVLALLGRAHNANRAVEAINDAQQRFENISIDLMCGIPGQSIQSLEASVQQAIALGVTHISIYPLTIEEHTPLYNQVLAGVFEEPDADTQAEHMQRAATLLQSAGYVRYEVASYAKPGFECRHNKAYWTGVPYLGLGKSAASMTQNAHHRMRVQDGVITDDLTPKQRAAEDLMLGMRLTEGVSFGQVTQAEALLPGLRETLAKLRKNGLVYESQQRFKPTNKGWLCGNELYEALFCLGE